MLIWKLLANFAPEIIQKNVFMDAKPKFNVIYSEEVVSFLNTLPDKAKAKVMFNVAKARYNQDPKLFKKLVGTEIWEFRTLYNGIQYRLLSFWDADLNTYVITTHGFIKKTQKTPQKEIERAEAIREEYYRNKNKR